MKSVCAIAVTLPKNQKTSSNMSEKNITFEDLPKAVSWLMDKLNELDSKIDGLNNQNQSVPTEQWMNLKELCDYIPSHPACLLYTSPSPRDLSTSRMPSSA